MPATAAHWRAKGFGQGLLDFIFGDERGMAAASPTETAAALARRGDRAAVAAALPPVALVHGTADDSAPALAAELLEARLRLLGAAVERTRLYAGWTHTDPILERPFAGDQRLHGDVFGLVAGWVDGTDPPLPRFDAAHPELGRFCPQWLIALGRACMPF